MELFEITLSAKPHQLFAFARIFQGFIVQDDPKAGVLVSGTALKLNSVNRHQSGNYTCFASNVEGDNESNALELRVMCK